MAIIIPTRNIYETQSRNIIAKNKTKTVVAKQKEISKEEKSLLSLTIQPSVYEKFSFLFASQHNFFPNRNIVSSSITSIDIYSSNTETMLRITGKLSSENYIVHNDVKASIRIDYNGGEYNGSISSQNKLVIEGTFSSLSSGEGYLKDIIIGLQRTVAKNFTTKLELSPLNRGYTEKKEYTFIFYCPMFTRIVEEVEGEAKLNAYAVTSVELEIYGNVYAETEKETTIGGGGDTHTIESNPFLVKESMFEETSLATKLGNDIIADYADGKENIRLRCDIADYYEDSGEKAISISGGDLAMCFMIGDLVKPMKLNERGENVPISRYKDGTPKIFRVCATNIFFDGAVWQELTLVEKSQTALAT